jgi:ribosomal protein S18 acetylase RimI-like enzyme
MKDIHKAIMNYRNIKRNESMSESTKVFVRNARDQDIPVVVEIDTEAFASTGTAEKPETYQLRLRTFPDGFLILIAENEIAAYGCSEKWLEEREPGLDENPATSHHIDGKILCITSMAVKSNFRGRGYGLLMLDKLIEIARQENCGQIILETTAQGFYLKRGFKTLRKRTEREIAMDVMSLTLKLHGKK